MHTEPVFSKTIIKKYMSMWKMTRGKNEPKEVRETKCTCEACGNVWFYGKEDEKEGKMNKIHNASRAMMCCGGCLPALLIKEKGVVDLGKCPKCGSRAVKKEVVTHNV